MAGAVNSRLLLRLMQVDSGEVVTHPARITLWLVNFDCFGQKKKKKNQKTCGTIPHLILA